MKTPRLALVVALLSLVLVLAQPAGAAPEPAASASSTSAAKEASAAAPACTAPTTRFCKWSGANFTGTKRNMPVLANGTCYQFHDAARSFVNNGGYEGYFYATSGCSGRSRAVTHNTQSADIGFTAWSFRYDCVSC